MASPAEAAPTAEAAPASRPARALTAGPASGPIAPFPLRIHGPVVAGFGRGSKELGIPTANIPISGLAVGGCEDVASGVYFGWCGLGDLAEGLGSSASTEAASAEAAGTGTGAVYAMVMSIGWNPFYKNTVRSVEVHVLHEFPHDFYGARLNLLILGYIRPELDYVSKEALIADIRTDMDVARRSLEREAYARFRSDESLVVWDGGEKVEAEEKKGDS
ncbi:MAG: riboflavin kinase [Trizodia sp. TS-e1964]|nr:MAG: riboflavin kinase [Trizodia sp. TS-e1964]